jgi:hypothetical protein
VKNVKVARAPVPAKKAAKKPPLRDVNAPGAAPPAAPMPHLQLTDDPDVFRNEGGRLVDKNGVLLGFANATAAETAYAEKLIGGPVDSPAKLMKRVALDPLLPLAMRLDAAKGAAPYYDKKMPISIEQKNEDLTIDLKAVAALPRPRRLALLEELKNLGVNLGPAT